MSTEQGARRPEDDPRVVASAQRLRLIPRWRVVKMFRAQREHFRLLFAVEREMRRRQKDEG